MSTTELLYKFIQLGLGSIDSFDIPDNPQWAEMIDLARGQGVIAITFDGYQRLGLQGVLPEIETMRWYGYANLVSRPLKSHLYAYYQ